MTIHPEQEGTDYSEGVESEDADAPGGGPDPIVFGPDPAAAGVRLDKYLAGRLAEVSRSRVQQWIALGAVTVDGVPRAPKSKLTGLERIRVAPLPREAERSYEPDPVPLSIVHEDQDLLVVDKPAGLVVHPAAGNWRGTLMNGLLHHRPDSAGLPRAGIVHRLDKDTSGLMVVARSERAVASLVSQMAARNASRRYLALAEGRLPARATVDAPIGRDPVDRTRMAADVPGKPARTHLQAVAEGSHGDRPVTLALARLDTGRTHQIRVHLRHLGHPIVGDAVYGRRFAKCDPIGRQALHAWRLSLAHPADGRPLHWEAALPSDFAHALAQVGIGPVAAVARAAAMDTAHRDAMLRQAASDDEASWLLDPPGSAASTAAAPASGMAGRKRPARRP